MQFVNQTENITKLPIEQCVSNISGWCGNQTKAYDKHTIAKYEAWLFDQGYTAQMLMRRAARVCYELMFHRYSYIDHVIILSGRGNNGADGIALAAICAQHNRNVQLVLTNANTTPLGQYMLKWAESCGVTVHELQKDDDEVSNWQDIKDQLSEIQSAVWVDALYGIGLNRDIAGIESSVIQYLNTLPDQSPILSIDIPSGLDADTGNIYRVCVKATLTVSFFAPKIGCLTNNGREQCGDLYISSLMQSKQSDKHIGRQSLKAIAIHSKSTQQSPLLPTNHNSHKNTWGNILIISGDHDMLGAAMLVVQGALAAGCGKIRLVGNQLDDAVRHQAPQVLGGDVAELAKHIKQASAVVIGPGMTHSVQNMEILKKVLDCSEQDKQIVIDAGALGLLADLPKDEFQNRGLNAVLTPHPKEAAQLLNCGIDSISANRLHACKKLAQRYRSSVLLKGSGTIVCDASEEVEATICPQGNCLLATGGTGDFLAGMIAALLARGMSGHEASTLASSVLGHCADKLCVVNSSRGLQISELSVAVRRLLFGGH